MSSLTWIELAKADDFLTANLIDNIDFWIQTRKVSTAVEDTSIIHKHIIYKILKKYVIEASRIDMKKCLNHIVARKETQLFLEKNLNFKSVLFKKHARKYVNLYAPDCGFQIMATDTYKAKTGGLESCVVASQKFERGEEIKYLEGAFADLDGEAEKLLDQNDFSVFYTSSNKYAKLMLGPSRFVNHDCNANAEFSPNGASGIKIIAKRIILQGEEISVRYAPDYFGRGNRDCLCSTCARNSKGFYDPKRMERLDESEFQNISSNEESSDDELENLNSNLTKDQRELKKEKATNKKLSDLIFIEVESDKDSEDQDDENISSREGTANISDYSDSEIPITPTVPNADLNNNNIRRPPQRFQDFKPPKIIDTEAVGGRRLRVRHKNLKYFDPSFNNPSFNNTSLVNLPIDTSFDSLSTSEYGKHNESVLKEREVQRRLHKVYFAGPYLESTDLSAVYDCLNCGIYFQFEANGKFREYCPRCIRHQKLFGLAWPDTKVTSYSVSLDLNYFAKRYSIAQSIEEAYLRKTQEELRKSKIKEQKRSKSTTPKPKPEQIEADLRRRILSRLGRISLPIIKNPGDSLSKLRVNSAVKNENSPTDVNAGLKKISLTGAFPASESSDAYESEEEENVDDQVFDRMDENKLNDQLSSPRHNRINDISISGQSKEGLKVDDANKENLKKNFEVQNPQKISSKSNELEQDEEEDLENYDADAEDLEIDELGEMTERDDEDDDDDEKYYSSTEKTSPADAVRQETEQKPIEKQIDNAEAKEVIVVEVEEEEEEEEEEEKDHQEKEDEGEIREQENNDETTEFWKRMREATITHLISDDEIEIGNASFVDLDTLDDSLNLISDRKRHNNETSIKDEDETGPESIKSVESIASVESDAEKNTLSSSIMNTSPLIGEPPSQPKLSETEVDIINSDTIDSFNESNIESDPIENDEMFDLFMSFANPKLKLSSNFRTIQVDSQETISESTKLTISSNESDLYITHANGSIEIVDDIDGDEVVSSNPVKIEMGPTSNFAKQTNHTIKIEPLTNEISTDINKSKSLKRLEEDEHQVIDLTGNDSSTDDKNISFAESRILKKARLMENSRVTYLDSQQSVIA